MLEKQAEIDERVRGGQGPDQPDQGLEGWPW